MGWLSVVTGRKQHTRGVSKSGMEHVPEFTSEPPQSSDYDELVPVDASLLVNSILGLQPQIDKSLFVADVRGARNQKRLLVKGRLDLSSVHYSLPLSLKCCEFEEQVDISQSRLETIDLSGSRMPGLKGKGARIDGDLVARFSEFVDEVDIKNAKIAGDLVLTGGQFSCNGGDSFDASGAVISGDVFLIGYEGRRVEALGSIRLDGVEVGGGVYVSGALLEGRGQSALSFRGSKVKLEVILDASDQHKLECRGEVTFVNSEVEGPFLVRGAALYGQQGSALTCEGSQFGSHVVLRSATDHEFVANGAVSFAGSRILGQFRVEGMKIVSLAQCAFFLQRVTVEETMFLSSQSGGVFDVVGDVSFEGAKIKRLQMFGARISGECSLRNATIDVIADDEESWPKERLLLNGLTYTGFGSNRTTEATVRLRWIKRQPKNFWSGRSIHTQPFYQLARVLASTGKRSEAQDVLFELERLRHQSRLAMDLLQDWLIGVAAYIATLAVGGWFLEKQLLPESGWSLVWFAIGVLLLLDLVDAAESWFRGLRPDNAIIGLLRWCYGCFERVFAGYGYRPFRAIGWLIALLLTSSLVFDLAHNRGVIITVPEKATMMSDRDGGLNTSSMPRIADGYPRFNSFFFSLDVMLPAINLGQSDYWQPIAGQDVKKECGPVNSPAQRPVGRQTSTEGTGLCSRDTRQALKDHWLIALGLSQAANLGVDLNWVVKGLENLFDMGLAVWWWWFEILFGGFLAIIAIAAFTGLLTRREEL